VAYLVGRREFWSLDFRTVPGVLIPRPETEVLVDAALTLASTGRESILDLGTGSGNIAVSLARELPGARITAVDISLRALRVAAANAAGHRVRRVRFLQSDLFGALGRRRFAIIVSNPPYIGLGEWRDLAPEVRDHEPRRAIVGGPRGTEFIQSLVDRSAGFLRPGGWLVLEIGAGQEREVRSMFGAGWEAARTIPDLAGIPRVVAARRSRKRSGATCGSGRSAGRRSPG